MRTTYMNFDDTKAKQKDGAKDGLSNDTNRIQQDSQRPQMQIGTTDFYSNAFSGGGINEAQRNRNTNNELSSDEPPDNASRAVLGQRGQKKDRNFDPLNDSSRVGLIDSEDQTMREPGSELKDEFDRDIRIKLQQKEMVEPGNDLETKLPKKKVPVFDSKRRNTTFHEINTFHQQDTETPGTKLMRRTHVVGTTKNNQPLTAETFAQQIMNESGGLRNPIRNKEKKKEVNSLSSDKEGGTPSRKLQQNTKPGTPSRKDGKDTPTRKENKGTPNRKGYGTGRQRRNSRFSNEGGFTEHQNVAVSQSKQSRAEMSSSSSFRDEPIREKSTFAPGRPMPLIAPGELVENLQKRTESSNRKYRAFKNFLKQQSSTSTVIAFGGGNTTKNQVRNQPKSSMNIFSSKSLFNNANTRKDSLETSKKQPNQPIQDEISTPAAQPSVDVKPRSSKTFSRLRTLLKIDNVTENQTKEQEEQSPTKGNNADMTVSDADDDFDDRYIHLIAAHSEINKAFGVLQPDQTIKALWDFIALIAILYQSIVIPFRLCFNEDATGGFKTFETIIDIIFLADIVITFNTGFYKKGYLVMKRKDIVINYLITWFFIDLIASFPYSWFFSMAGQDDSADAADDTSQDQYTNAGSGQGSTNGGGSNLFSRTPQLLRLIRIVRFLRFLRLLRVFKLKKLLYKFEEIIMSDTINAILGFIKVITVILFIAHWIACIFFFIGSSQLDSEPLCWLSIAGVQDEETADKYVISLYWAFTTMTTVGYGDVVPYTMSEKIYAIFSMLIACGVFAYVVGSIETIARRSNTMASVFKEKILHVNQFLLHKNIPKYLRLKVRRYLEYMFEYKKQYKLSEVEVLNMLNENLKDQVIVHLNGRMLKNTRIFGVFDFRFLSEVTFLLANETFSMDDHIFEEDERGTKMYFITKGTVVIMQKSTHTYIKELLVDEYFGEVAFFSDLPRQATARSRGFTEVLSLNKDSFVETAKLQQYPGAAKTYSEIHEKLTNPPHDYSIIYATCYLCGKMGHISVHCEELFKSIKGNLQRQIQQIKNSLKGETQKQDEASEEDSEGVHQDKDFKDGGEEADDETEEIKTELYIDLSDVEGGADDNQSQSMSVSGQTPSAVSSKKKYGGGGGLDHQNSSQSMNKPSTGLGKKMMQGTHQGGVRLNVNVGASNIQTAKRFQGDDQNNPKRKSSSKRMTLLSEGIKKKSSHMSFLIDNNIQRERAPSLMKTIPPPAIPQTALPKRESLQDQVKAPPPLQHPQTQKQQTSNVQRTKVPPVEQDGLPPQPPDQSFSTANIPKIPSFPKMLMTDFNNINNARKESFSSAKFGIESNHQESPFSNTSKKRKQQKGKAANNNNGNISSNSFSDSDEDLKMQLHKQIITTKENRERDQLLKQQQQLIAVTQLQSQQSMQRASQIKRLNEEFQHAHNEEAKTMSNNFFGKNNSSLGVQQDSQLVSAKVKGPPPAKKNSGKVDINKTRMLLRDHDDVVGNFTPKQFRQIGQSAMEQLKQSQKSPQKSNNLVGQNIATLMVNDYQAGFGGFLDIQAKALMQNSPLLHPEQHTRHMERIKSFNESSKVKTSFSQLSKGEKASIKGAQASNSGRNPDTPSERSNKSVRRSGTVLLGQIKETPIRPKGLQTPQIEKNSPVVVVPSDLGIGLIKDLIPFENEHEKKLFDKAQDAVALAGSGKFHGEKRKTLTQRNIGQANKFKEQQQNEAKLLSKAQSTDSFDHLSSEDLKSSGTNHSIGSKHFQINDPTFQKEPYHRLSSFQRQSKK